MDIPSIDSVEPFQTKDGSTIRELAHPAWTLAVNQSLAHATLPVGLATDEHYHPVAEEIYHFTAGSGRMRLGEDEFLVEPGQAVVIPPGVAHKLWNTGAVALTLICCCAPAYSNDDTVLTGR
ncbi:MAG: cupin domain-containing protein [Solirubrobacterales bacterium]|nr:cupin domain-containing protein [Solirubrobacterales bacterium]